MAKKHYCRKCEKLIDEGKEIKVSKGSNYYSSRYSSGPQDYATYYLCPQCYQQQQEEIQAQSEKTWQQVGRGLLIFSVNKLLGNRGTTTENREIILVKLDRKNYMENYGKRKKIVLYFRTPSPATVVSKDTYFVLSPTELAKLKAAAEKVFKLANETLLEVVKQKECVLEKLGPKVAIIFPPEYNKNLSSQELNLVTQQIESLGGQCQAFCLSETVITEIIDFAPTDYSELVLKLSELGLPQLPSFEALFIAGDKSFLNTLKDKTDLIPPTYVLSKNDLTQNLSILAKDKVVLKPGDFGNGEGIFFGKNFTESAWKDKIREAMESKQSRVIQERCYLRNTPDGRYEDISIYVVDGVARGFVSRISANEIEEKKIIDIQPLLRMRELLKKSLQDVEDELDEMAAVQAFEVKRNLASHAYREEILTEVYNVLPKFIQEFASNARKFSDLDICYLDDIPRPVINNIREELEESDLPFMKKVIFEIDQLASKSDKSIICRYGNTTVLTVLTVKQLTKSVNSFFPLSISFEEKFYAVGRIPNAFGKREGKPSYDAITAARLIDRSLRTPSLPYFSTPLAAVIVGQEGKDFICNPSNEKLNSSPLELIVSATEDKITMLEAGAQEIGEVELEKAIEFAHQKVQILIGFFQHIASSLGVKKNKIGVEQKEITDHQ
ncbi:15460_t:CDS:10 [Entrophospora sp. SA101]|nr:15460_t:CDS:10 [Entrophospora sp. SA101]